MKRLASRPCNKIFHIFSFFIRPTQRCAVRRPKPTITKYGIENGYDIFFGGGLRNMIGQWNSELLHNLKKSDFLAALFLSFVLSYKRG
jgi:hypothetical protein